MENSIKNNENKNNFFKKIFGFLFKSKKRIIISFISVIILSLFLFKGCSVSTNSNIKLSTYNVQKQNMEKTVNVNGIIEGSDSAEITSNLNYEFVSINVQEGDYVKKGDVLGVLNNKDLSSDYNISLKEYEIAKSQLYEQQENTKLLVKEREIEYNEAKRQNEINKELFEEGSISKDEMIQSDILLEKSFIALSNAQNQLKQSSSIGSAFKSLEIKQELLNAKKDNLDKSKITSPIEGTVTRVNAKLGRIPTAQNQSRAMFIVENLNDLIINVKISEFDIGEIKVGQKVIISSDVLKNKNVDGIVSRIAPTGETSQDSSSSEMKIPVQIKITNKESLIAGVKAKAKIIVDKKNDIIAVPIESVIEENGEKYVFTGNNNVLSKVKITTGMENISFVEVTSKNINEGDIIITNPSTELKDGDSYTNMEQTNE